VVNLTPISAFYFLLWFSVLSAFDFALSAFQPFSFCNQLSTPELSTTSGLSTLNSQTINPPPSATEPKRPKLWVDPFLLWLWSFLLFCDKIIP
jgi:hypothetical protein